MTTNQSAKDKALFYAEKAIEDPVFNNRIVKVVLDKMLDIAIEEAQRQARKEVFENIDEILHNWNCQNNYDIIRTVNTIQNRIDELNDGSNDEEDKR
jgi:hypothetical protein